MSFMFLCHYAIINHIMNLISNKNVLSQNLLIRSNHHFSKQLCIKYIMFGYITVIEKSHDI